MYMKKILCAIVLCLSTCIASATCWGYTKSLQANLGYGWEPVPCDYIPWSLTNYTLVIESKNRQIYHIYKTETISETPERRELWFWATDKDGVNCRVRFLIRGTLAEFYIEYNNIRYAYSITVNCD